MICICVHSGTNQEWSFEVRTDPHSGVSIINITYTSHQSCADKFARGQVNVSNALNVRSSTTATLPNVTPVSNTAISVSGLQHCVEYEGYVWVSYPKLSDTSAKRFIKRAMLCKWLETQAPTGMHSHTLPSYAFSHFFTHPHITPMYMHRSMPPTHLYTSTHMHMNT